LDTYFLNSRWFDVFNGEFGHTSSASESEIHFLVGDGDSNVLFCILIGDGESTDLLVTFLKCLF